MQLSHLQGFSFVVGCFTRQAVLDRAAGEARDDAIEHVPGEAEAEGEGGEPGAIGGVRPARGPAPGASASRQRALGMRCGCNPRTMRGRPGPSTLQELAIG
jgi:hypothetical protein